MCKCGHDFVMHFCAWLCVHFSDRFMGNVWVLYGTIGLVGWLVGLLDLLNTELSLETQVLVKQPWRFTYVDHINSFQDWF